MEWLILLVLVAVGFILPFLAERVEERRQRDAWTAHLHKPLRR